MIRILPLEQIKENGLTKNFYLRSIENDSHRELSEIIGSDYTVFESGKAAIRALIEDLKLTRNDEVLITTTTDTSFVSTCVSATIFNYCKISRILTENTKAIFIIHNFGFPHTGLKQLRLIADERMIPLIEDCAFGFDSYNDEGIRLGSIGDFSIYSLPKIFPIEYGGILSGKNHLKSRNSDEYLAKQIKEWVPKLWHIKKMRTSNYLLLFREFSRESIYKEAVEENPFVFGLCTYAYKEIEKMHNDVEFSRTHVINEIHIPVNAFAESMEYESLIVCLMQFAHSHANIKDK
ncbi:MAG: DegT/DnrJ/EryC1/StrS aminotransferase family protein [Candidatus Scalindua sp.]|jgi:hypothetical protein|nr:DegT/DnrJ/EryC1/StrS aminotransferase family protein [Candidatus Scalindua sp.]